MSETLTAAVAGNSAPNEDSVRLGSLTAENINLSPLLTLSQEEHVLRDLHFRFPQICFFSYDCNVSDLLLFSFSTSFYSTFHILYNA